MDQKEFYTTTVLKRSMPSKEKKASSLPGFLKVFAYMELLAGFILSLVAEAEYDFTGPIVFLLLLSSVVPCIVTLGFAKIVEAADKYLRK